MSLPPPTNQTVVPSTATSGKLIKQITDQQTDLVIPANGNYALFDDQQTGELVGFEIAVNLADVVLQVYIYADNYTFPNFINNRPMDDLLGLGRGLTPGDVTTLPNLQTQDIQGKPSPIYPFLSRYKDDLLPDYTGWTDRKIVLRFEPAIYPAYKRIVANIINTNGALPATIINLDIKRIIYEELAETDVPRPPDANKGTANVRRTITLKTSPPVYAPYKPKPKPAEDTIVYEPT